jgi:hypothetical protein
VGCKIFGVSSERSDKPIVTKCQCKHCGKEIKLGQTMIPVYFDGFIHEKCRKDYLRVLKEKNIEGIQGQLGDYFF